MVQWSRSNFVWAEGEFYYHALKWLPAKFYLNATFPSLFMIMKHIQSRLPTMAIIITSTIWWIIKDWSNRRVHLPVLTYRNWFNVLYYLQHRGKAGWYPYTLRSILRAYIYCGNDVWGDSRTRSRVDFADNLF